MQNFTNQNEQLQKERKQYIEIYEKEDYAFYHTSSVFKNDQ